MSIQLVDEALAEIRQHWNPQQFPAVTTLVAVSGGADSVALLRLVKTLYATNETGKDMAPEAPPANHAPTTADRQPPSPQSHASGSLVVAHWNHRLRGADADEDARFVQRLSQQLGCRCIVGQSSSALQSPGEAALRDERYQFLTETAHGVGARYVALAHTADDVAETVLHQLLRGTGPTGLAGMPRFRPLGPEAVLVRPLLGLRRQQLRAILQQLKQNWRHDASNDVSVWTRNWMRNEIIPQLSERFADPVAAIARAAGLQAELLEDVSALKAQFSRELFIDPQWDQPLGPLQVRGSGPLGFRKSLVILLLRDAWDRKGWPRGSMSQTHWEALANLIRGEVETGPAAGELPAGQGSGRIATDVQFLNLPGGIRADRRGDGTVVVSAGLGD